MSASAAGPGALDPALLELFAAEAEVRLADLAAGLTELAEGASVAAVLVKVLRDVHTLKGAAAVVRLDEVARVAHALEQVLLGLQDGRLLPGAAIVDVLRTAVGDLGSMVPEVLAGRDASLQADAQEAALLALVDGATGWPARSTQPFPPPRSAPPRYVPRPGPTSEPTSGPRTGGVEVPVPDDVPAARFVRVPGARMGAPVLATFVEFEASTGRFAVAVEQTLEVQAIPKPARGAAAAPAGGLNAISRGGRTLPVLETLGHDGERMLILATRTEDFALRVRRVLGLFRVEPTSVQEPPEAQRAGLVSGVIHREGNTVMIVDADALAARLGSSAD